MKTKLLTHALILSTMFTSCKHKSLEEIKKEPKELHLIFVIPDDPTGLGLTEGESKKEELWKKHGDKAIAAGAGVGAGLVVAGIVGALMHRKAARLSSELAGANETIGTHELTILTRNGELNVAKATIATNKAEIEQKTKELTIANSTIVKQNATILDKNTELAKADNTIAVNKIQLSQEKQKNETLQTHKELLISDYEKTRNENLRLKSSTQPLTKAREEATAKILDLKSQFDDNSEKFLIEIKKLEGELTLMLADSTKNEEAMILLYELVARKTAAKQPLNSLFDKIPADAQKEVAIRLLAGGFDLRVPSKERDVIFSALSEADAKAAKEANPSTTILSTEAEEHQELVSLLANPPPNNNNAVVPPAAVNTEPKTWYQKLFE